MEKIRIKKYSKIKREIIDTYIFFSNSDNSKNIIVFKDENGKSKIIRANETLINEYKRRKSEENSQNIRFSRYIEHLELTENSVNKRAINKEISLEEQVISNLESERILKEIWKLPTPQNRRVYMYIVDEFSYTKIAKIENRSIPTVKESIDRGLENLRKKLKKFYK